MDLGVGPVDTTSVDAWLRNLSSDAGRPGCGWTGIENAGEELALVAFQEVITN